MVMAENNENNANELDHNESNDAPEATNKVKLSNQCKYMFYGDPFFNAFDHIVVGGENEQYKKYYKRLKKLALAIKLIKLLSISCL